MIDSAKVETTIRKNIPKLINVDYPVTDVSCPKDPDVVKGKTFDCDYTVDDDSQGTVTVTMTDSKGAISYEVTDFASGQVEQDIFNVLDIDLDTVDCPDTIEDGAECDFEDTDGDAGVVTISMDDDANLSYSAEYS